MIEKTCTGERKLRSVDGSDGRGVCQPKMRLKELKGKKKGSVCMPGGMDARVLCISAASAWRTGEEGKAGVVKARE